MKYMYLKAAAVATTHPSVTPAAKLLVLVKLTAVTAAASASNRRGEVSPQLDRGTLMARLAEPWCCCLP